MAHALILDPAANPDECATQVAGLPDVVVDLAEIGLGGLLTGKGVVRDPARYVAIFEVAGCKAEAKGKRWLAFACEVEACNGLRRDPKKNLEAVEGRLRDVLGQIQTLSSGKGRALLEAGAWYNLALVSRGQRDYSGAGYEQSMASLCYALAGLAEKAAVCNFLVEVEWASQAVSDGNPAVIAVALRRLREARGAIQDTLLSCPTWMADNAAVHVWWLHVMARVPYVEQGADAGEINVKFRMPHWQPLSALEQALRAGDFKLVLDFADQIVVVCRDIKSSSSENSLLTAQLFKAQALLGLGREDEARAVAQEVADWPGRDGGVPMGVAQRWLKATFG